MDETKLESFGRAQLDRRKDVGLACIEEAAGHPVTEDDNEELETYASDAISDILTAVYGPAGHYTWRPEGVGLRVDNTEALDNAQGLLSHAMRSYEGDAEDYTLEPEPEPGQYGYEEPEKDGLDIASAVMVFEVLEQAVLAERQIIEGHLAKGEESPVDFFRDIFAGVRASIEAGALEAKGVKL